MALTPGTHLGPYEIIGAVGAGGMGEVYRARDGKLNRDVAIKVLPELFASDPERLARFTREAQVLAALNHPNIAHIHGLEESSVQGRESRVLALVMEFVEGEDLSAHIARGPMPLAEVVPIAAQIAAAVETAHEQGIIHRDLKPANVKLRPDGTVKVLDFGLAKALTEDAGGYGGRGAEAMNSPTLTARATAMGMIIGTAAYMAPEQAKGKPVDRRADIWAFGVVLYEMLTGRRAFDGEDVSTTLAAVLMKDPDWGPLPATTPPAIRTLIHRCLNRDPKQRLRDIGEARILLADPAALRESELSAPPATTPPAATATRRAGIIAMGVVVAAVIFGTLFRSMGRDVPAGQRIEASLAPPKGHSFGRPFAISPDGRRVVIPVSVDETGTISLWIRDLSSGQLTEIPHTENGWQPFWSPDGREIAFFADAQLKRVDLQGSPPQVICAAPSPRGGTWGPDNLIVFAGAFRAGLEKVDARGGKPEPLTTLDAKRDEKSHRWPEFLPGGKDILFLAQMGEGGSKDDTSAIEVLTLATVARTRLVTANSSPHYSPAGYLLFWREGALRAQAFDAASRAVSGDVLPVANDVAYDDNEHVAASIASNGTVIYATGPGAVRSSLQVVDRTGKVLKTIADSLRTAGNIALSHDGSRLAVGTLSGTAKELRIQVFDITRGTSSALTFEDGEDFNPAWSEDDSQLAYTNDLKDGGGALYRRSADGRGQRQKVAERKGGFWLWDWSKDGAWLLAGGSGGGSPDIFKTTIDGKTITPLIATTYVEDTAALSADNRWLAYASDETGLAEVYVRPMAGDGKWMVSNTGGASPMWRRDGRELYYVTSRNQVMAVQVDSTGPAPRFGVPVVLFHANLRSWDVDRAFAPFADGKQFVIDTMPNRSATLLTIVTNWTGPNK